ncbi:hypothetical protein NDU88_009678 [Pleurodeles waltl]|uniref:Uncharacterized protein n=1 Tax=Pleurodeles waltl TaxID=8319 RepID=A0AAV7PT52_PLEWA|nr:hypothetical protein NDU88_009678 [Pleurodeles waltl]
MREGHLQELAGLRVSQEAGCDWTGAVGFVSSLGAKSMCSLKLRGGESQASELRQGLFQVGVDVCTFYVFRKSEKADIVSATPILQDDYLAVEIQKLASTVVTRCSRLVTRD